jgi:PAS domain S-box-containing protein
VTSKKSKSEELEIRIREMEKKESKYKETIRHLRLNEKRFRNLYEQIPLGYQSLDSQGRFIEVNEAWLNMMGYSSSEVIGKWFGDFLAPHELDAFEQRFPKFISNGEVHTDVQILKRDGSQITVHIDGRIGKDKRGKFKETHCILYDITERKRAEEVLRGSEEKYRNLIGSLQEGIWLIDKDAYTTFVNPPMADMLGYTVDEIQGKHLFDFMDEKDIEIANKKLESRRRGIKEQHEFEFRRKDGSSVFTILVTNPINDKDGNYAGAIAGVIDITEQKQIEAMLKSSETEKSAILDAMSELVAYQDLEHNVLWTNRAAAVSVNEEQEKLIGRKCFKIWAGREEECDICPVAKAIETGNVQRDKIMTPDGRIWNITGYPLKNETGEILNVVEVTADITKSEQVNEELRDSWNMLQTVLDSIPSGVFWKDRDLNYLGVNRAWLAVIGLKSSEEVIGKSDYDLTWSKEEADSFREKDRKIIESGIPEYDIIEPYTRFDGTQAWAKTNKAPLRDAKGNIVGILGTYEDITERKRAEEVLRESEEKYRTLFENMAQGAFYQRADGMVVDGNQAALEMFGVTRDQFLGRTSMDPRWKVIHEDGSDFPGEQHPSIEALRTGKPVRSVVAGIFNPGKEDYVWLNINAIPQFKPGEDRPYQVFVTMHDITERKKAEEEREKLQAQLSNAVEMAHLGHWEYDVAKDLFTFNDHFYKIFRTTAKKVGGYTISSAEYARLFVHPDDMHLVAEEIQKAIETTDPNFKRQLEHRIIYSDGTVGHISVQFFVVKDAQGKTIKTYGVNQDITEHKRMEEEFIRSQKLESVAVLAGGIAHDFNNILTVILGNASLARMRVSPEDEIFGLLSEVETASARAQTLTKQLLTFAKGGVPVKEIASIKDVVKESSLFVLRGSKSRCEFSIVEDLWSAEVDVGQISQVINNIVINANQAMPEGGIIQVAAENLIIDVGRILPFKPGRYIRISIIDQGVGIPEKHLPKIFDPYFTTKQEGSGLGLATTYSIIKRHDGHIIVESNLGVGTTIHIYLPASEKAIPEKEETRVIKGQGRILVMDDEASLRRTVGRMLEKLGYEPELAKDGAEAIEMVKEAKEAGKSYDAVILDLTVPGGMGGKECITRLLEIDPGIKAIVSSGYSEDPVLANFHEYGFKGMMPKPFAALSLSKVLHDVLKGEKK